MPVLPLIDLLILMGWTGLLAAFVLKFVSIAMNDRVSILSLTAMDFLLAAVACLLFALTLAARTWVKANEPRLVARRLVGSYGLERLKEDADDATAHDPPGVRSAPVGRRNEAAAGR